MHLLIKNAVNYVDFDVTNMEAIPDATSLRCHANVWRRFRESIRKTVANSSHPSEIGAILIDPAVK